MNKAWVIAAYTAFLAVRAVTDEERFLLALVQFRQNPGRVTGFHVVTAGLFLERDLGELG